MDEVFSHSQQRSGTGKGERRIIRLAAGIQNKAAQKGVVVPVTETTAWGSGGSAKETDGSPANARAGSSPH